ncbi:hypothetical protein BBO99_00008034 [Phytophthora kernoviae]|uniref:Uncharacterized protein n=2 Tax=Phytophthora kernoviae TaxID=325452 RepID=A0A3R7JDS3_9STRA|nr:hypothetical protein G195_009096 [Phytophthora kernoviae 00238/432]KAG2515877.1 hypothetical protein JM16_007684 [Phytophthora kernoviae]KAG2519325.1 hypothetical protein JM18_007590 [Phytophthora kernoviae]RLN38320.1 hypothetical protein BBI17_007955 [Phytophthora kernoviae]RLN75832.1 hypothetical protein BBO99_00008034 [Phytophthora kernoviae]
MPERQHSRHDVEEELGDERVLAPNTSYIILLATETVGAQGVLSKNFEEPLRVRTHELSPSFTKMHLEPRTGSTTEMLLTFALDRPGEVHYMLGVSANAEFNATSPHNISSKGAPDNDRHGRGKNSHDYRHNIVQMQRSVSYSGGEHIELLDNLAPGTSYSLFIVSEAAPADHGVYGNIHEIKEVSTFANAPILLAHAAYPTPGTTQALTVGFRMDAPGIVYFSAVAVQPWTSAHHVAKGSDRYGNRLALEDRLVLQKRLEVDEMSMEVAHDSGWREQTLEVPQTGLNYTIHLVTETKGSGGIYGTVATHTGVRAHLVAPELLDVLVSPTDARVDALSVNVTLSDRGHVHYIALPNGKTSTPPSDDILQQSTELTILASGSVDINETAGSTQERSFTITSLTEGTAYDLYFRTETLESFGVFGSWTRDAMTTRTHGLPPDVLPDAVECNLMPSCEQRGRETCSRKPNICGECLAGYTSATDDEETSAIEPCVKLSTTSTDNQRSRGGKIKINAIKRNPNLHLPEAEREHADEPEPEKESTREVPQQPLEHDLELKEEREQPDLIRQQAEENSLPHQRPMAQEQELGQAELMQPQEQGPMQQQEPQQEQELDQRPQALDQGLPTAPQQSGDNAPVAPVDSLSHSNAQSNEKDVQAGTGCPLNAHLAATGLCECFPGFEAGIDGKSCVLSRMTTPSEAVAAASSASFDVSNAHHPLPSHST